jgi:hypothetical protein
MTKLLKQLVQMRQQTIALMTQAADDKPTRKAVPRRKPLKRNGR